MSKARDMYYKALKEANSIQLTIWTPVYMTELEQQNAEYWERIEINHNHYLELSKSHSELEQQKAELVGSLAIALDDNKRKLYKDCLLKTLNKLKEK